MLTEQPQGAALVTAGLRLPYGTALGQRGVNLFGRFALALDADDVQLAGGNIDLDEVAFLYQSDGATGLASGLQWPMTGPVDAPEKRPSVMRAMLRPSSLSELMASLV